MIKIIHTGEGPRHGMVGYVTQEVWNQINFMQMEKYNPNSSAGTIYQFVLHLIETPDDFNFLRCMVLRGIVSFALISEPNDVLKDII